MRRPWLHVIQQLATVAVGPRPPYGSVEPKIEFAFGRLSAALEHLQAFATEARAALPNEHAAWIVWNAQALRLEYLPLKTTNASPGSIQFERPTLPEWMSLAIDLHSHGAGEAFFSPTDDADDAGEVKISAVFGGLADGGTPSAVFRLCVLGLNIPLRVPAAAIFQTAEAA